MGRRRRQLRWWPVEVREGVEIVAADNDIVWVPMYRICVLEHGEWSEHLVELLPGYILVGTLEQTLVLRGGVLLSKPLSEHEVLQLKAMEQTSEFKTVGEFSSGQNVIIRQNSKTAYAGLMAEFISTVPMCGGYFAKVMVDLYGDDRTVMLPLDYLEV